MSDSTRNLLSQVLPVLAILISAFAAFYQLSESPAIWYDEGFFEQGAMNLAAHGAQVMQLAPGNYLSSWSISAGYPLMYPMSVLFTWFGASVFTARAVTAGYLVLFVIAAYFFVRRESGIVPAAIVVFLLASFPILYGNGKSVLGEVPALFYFVLMLFSLQALERSSYTNRFAALMTGLTAGLSFAAKFTFMLVPAAFFLAFLFRWRKLLAEIDAKNWALGALGFILPVGVWFMLQFQPGDSVSTVLEFFANPYDYGATALGGAVLGNLMRFVTEVTPLYMLVIFVPWVFSFYLTHKEGKRLSMPELVAFAFSCLILLAYLRTPGWYRYFFPAMVAGMLYFPQSIEHCWKALSEKISFLRKVPWLPYAGFVLLVLLQFYQLGWNSYVATYYDSTRTAELSAYFSQLDPSKTVFLYNVPEIAIFLPSQDFYQYLNPHVNQGFGADELPLLAAGAPDTVVVNSDTYDAEQSEFTKYSIKDHIAHYLVLARTP